MRHRIESELLDTPVRGRGLDGSTLRDQLAPERPTLVAFVRHLG